MECVSEGGGDGVGNSDLARGFEVWKGGVLFFLRGPGEKSESPSKAVTSSAWGLMEFRCALGFPSFFFPLILF